jgi:predicted lipid-binding transport protein (Tim44 family)
MIYLLLIGGAIALAVWTGRRALPRLKGKDWRVASGGLAALTLLGGIVAGMRGAWMIGGGLMLVGLGLAATVRFSRQSGARKVSPGAAPSDSEARAILGVGPSADEAEIQAAYSRLMRMAHPDMGGTSGLAAQLNAARDQLLGRVPQGR